MTSYQLLDYGSYEVIFQQISFRFPTDLLRFASEGSDSLFLQTGIGFVYRMRSYYSLSEEMLISVKNRHINM